MRPQIVWQDSIVLRARDLPTPASVTGDPGAGPSTGVLGPRPVIAIPAAVSALTAVWAILALSQRSLFGLLIFGGMSVVFGRIAWVARLTARHPVVVVGPGGVWLAGTESEPGRVVPWGDVDELVLCAVTERPALDPRSAERARPRSALGVRLRVAPALSAHDRQRLGTIFGGLPERHDATIAGMTALLGMPYRRVDPAAAHQVGPLRETVARHAPHVRVVEGPPVVLDIAWRPVADAAPQASVDELPAGPP